MKFISNKVRIKKAAISTSDVYHTLKNPDGQMSLPMTKPSTAPMPKPEFGGEYKQPTLPMELPKGHTPYGPHNTKEHNIFNDLEGPELANLGTQEPHRTVPTGRGINAALFHIDQDGNKTGVAKADSNSYLKEPLVYQIGQHIQPGLIPETVIRNHKDENFGSNKIIPHSFQRYSPGFAHAELHRDDERDMENNPHYSAIRAFDYLISNRDRHEHNLRYDPHNSDPNQRIKAIDNGGAFDSMGDINDWNQVMSRLKNAHAPFDPKFIEGIKNADENYLSNLFSRVNNHPESKPSYNEKYRLKGFLQGNGSPISVTKAKDEMLQRLQQLKNAFNAGVTNPQQLHRYLTKNIEPGGPKDNPHGNTHDNTFNNTHNNLFNNTYDNAHNNLNDNTRNNTYNNTYNNIYNNTHENTANNSENAFLQNTEDFNKEPKLKPEFQDGSNENLNHTPVDNKAIQQDQKKELEKREKDFQQNQHKLNLKKLIEHLRNNQGTSNDTLRRMLNEAKTQGTPDDTIKRWLNKKEPESY